MNMDISRLTPDEKVDLEIFFVLQKIKKYNRYRVYGESIDYRIYSPPDLLQEGMPFPIEELKVINLLVKEDVILKKDPEKEDKIGIIEETLSNGLRKVTIILYLEFLPKFDVFYKTYQDKSKNVMAKLSGDDVKTYFGFEDKTFQLRRADNSVATINFYPRNREITNPYCLLFTLVYLLKKGGNRNNLYFEVIANRGDIINVIKSKFKINITPAWIKSTKGNLVKKIPKEYIESDLIRIRDYDGRQKGFPFALKLPH